MERSPAKHALARYLSMPLYKDKQYDQNVYNILESYSLPLAEGYVYLCKTKDYRQFDPVFFMYSISADISAGQATDFINNKNPTIREFIELNTEVWHIIARHFTRTREERYNIVALRNGAPHLVPRLKRVKSNSELIGLISTGFPLTKVTHVYDLSGQSCRYIMSTPYYRYGVQPTMADMPAYRAMLETNDLYEQQMIRHVCSRVYHTDDELYAACTGDFHLLFDHIREYRALRSWLQRYADVGLASHYLIGDIRESSSDWAAQLENPFNLVICPAFYEHIKNQIIIEKIAMQSG